MPIVTHLIATYKLWHEFLPHISKVARYTLGEKIDTFLIEVAELSFTAGYVARERKLQYLEQAITKLDLVKFFLQMAWEIKAIDDKKYLLLSDRLNEAGRMLGGWARQTTAKESPTP